MKRYLLLSFLMIISLGLTGQSIGIIGDATPGGWDNDTDMTQDSMNADLWHIDITLFDGAAKFRLDDDWVMNWGSMDFPIGIGIQDGDNIPVFAGDYSITFNSATGEYNFDVDSDIGIIGDATPGGWDADTDMYKDQTDPNKFFIDIDLTAASAKFRKDDDWAVNWGSADFPTGIGVQEGENIPVSPAARYRVTLDTMSGEYSFASEITYGSIGIIGDATPGGWDNDTDMNKDPNNGELWTAQITLTDGLVKFRADDDWTTNWGGTDFPTGVAEQGGPDLMVTAGDYFVTFNSTSGEYDFKAIVEYATVGIIGDATPGGWDADTDMAKDPDDVHSWSIRMTLLDGEAKFRADDDWPVNWGAGEFPVGIGVQDGANIPITAGDYIITFNSLTGAYNFSEVVEYGTVGIIGVSGPFADWDNDTPLNKNPDDFNLWTLGSISLVDFDPAADGGVKFRADNDWGVNWGAPEFPGGIGTAGGPNIEPVAGDYSVAFNSSTGEYLFAEPSSTQDILDPSAINAYPNPAHSLLSVDLSTIELIGKVQLKVINLNGQTVLTNTIQAEDLKSIDISDLPTGAYMLNISNDKFLLGKRFSVAK